MGYPLVRPSHSPEWYTVSRVAILVANSIMVFPENMTAVHRPVPLESEKLRPFGPWSEYHTNSAGPEWRTAQAKIREEDSEPTGSRQPYTAPRPSHWACEGISVHINHPLRSCRPPGGPHRSKSNV